MGKSVSYGDTLIFKRNFVYRGFVADASSGSWSSARLPSTEKWVNIFHCSAHKAEFPFFLNDGNAVRIMTLGTGGTNQREAHLIRVLT